MPLPWPLDVLAYRYRAQRLPESVGFDEQFGTETAAFDWFGNYEPTRPTVVDAVLDALDLDWPRWAFVDLGSGKGRVVLMAALRPFARAVGIEHAPSLHRQAVANAEAFPETAAPVVFLCADAAEEPLPAGPLVLFLYNPFGAPLLRRVLHRLGDRPACVAYVNPNHPEVVEAAGFTEVARDREGEVQHWRVYRRAGPR